MIDRETAMRKDIVIDGMSRIDYQIGEIVRLHEDRKPFCGRLAMILGIKAFDGKGPELRYSLMVDEKHGTTCGAGRMIPLPQTPEIQAAFQKQLEEARKEYRSGRK